MCTNVNGVGVVRDGRKEVWRVSQLETEEGKPFGNNGQTGKENNYYSSDTTT